MILWHFYHFEKFEDLLSSGNALRYSNFLNFAAKPAEYLQIISICYISLSYLKREKFEDLLSSGAGRYIFKLFYTPVLSSILPYFAE